MRRQLRPPSPDPGAPPGGLTFAANPLPSLDRRRFALLTGAAAFAPSLGRADVPTAAIIAEGGSAFERIIDTASAFNLAIVQGCDFLQVSLVPTKDGVLLARRSNELSATTDVASKTAFADRKAQKTIDGQAVTGWFSEDFTLAEIKTLRSREPLPDVRPQNTRNDGKEPVLTLAEVLDIARAGCVRTGRVIGVCARMLHPAYFEELGTPIEDKLARDLTTAGYVSPAAALWVEAYEPSALRTFQQFSPVRRMQLIDLAGAPSNDPDHPYAQMVTEEGLSAVHGWAEGIGVDQGLVIDLDAVDFPTVTTLVAGAHAAGLAIFSRTARPENGFLPGLLQKGKSGSPDFAGRRGDVGRLMTGLFATGVDGVATDAPAAAAKARDAASHGATGGPSGH